MAGKSGRPERLPTAVKRNKEIIMSITKLSIGFHEQALATGGKEMSPFNPDTRFTYTFENFFHPFVGELIAMLNRDSLVGMLDATWQAGLQTPDPKTDPKEDFFHELYNPADDTLVKVESFAKVIDVSTRTPGPYANYNWELFFHIPLMVATHLSKNQRFPEAQRWFHYIFDPTSTEQTDDPLKRFWEFLPFRKDENNGTIDEIVRILSRP